jgi:hypothetical protein
MARAKGEILCWINSDDAIASGVVAVMKETLVASEDPAWARGQYLIIDDSGNQGQCNFAIS